MDFLSHGDKLEVKKLLKKLKQIGKWPVLKATGDTFCMIIRNTCYIAGWLMWWAIITSPPGYSYGAENPL